MRNTTFTKDNLMSFFEKYADDFERSGSFQREQLKWGVQAGIADELLFISNWLDARLSFLDNNL